MALIVVYAVPLSMRKAGPTHHCEKELDVCSEVMRVRKADTNGGDEQLDNNIYDTINRKQDRALLGEKARVRAAFL